MLWTHADVMVLTWSHMKPQMVIVAFLPLEYIIMRTSDFFVGGLMILLFCWGLPYIPKLGWIPLPVCHGFFRLNSSATPTDLLKASRPAEPFWSIHLHTFIQASVVIERGIVCVVQYEQTYHEMSHAGSVDTWSSLNMFFIWLALIRILYHYFTFYTNILC